MRNPFIRSLLLLAVLAAGWRLVSLRAEPKPAAGREMPVPEFDDAGRLLRPVDFETWVVVGTSIGLGYTPGDKADPKNPGQFNNVYLQRQAFDHFVETGEFPEQTVFVVTNQPSRSTKDDGKSAIRAGFFAAPTVGMEVSVKDSTRYPDDGWGYFMFHDKPGEKKKKRDAEKPFVRKDCADCHAEHAATDMVFTQYYSVLTEARRKRLAEK